MSDEIERALALEDLQHALIIQDDALRRDAMRRLGHDDDEISDELTDREKVDGLRALVLVELITAMGMERNSYVSGRIASYELVLDAIGRRWSDMADWQGDFEHHFERHDRNTNEKPERCDECGKKTKDLVLCEDPLFPGGPPCPDWHCRSCRGEVG